MTPSGWWLRVARWDRRPPSLAPTLGSLSPREANALPFRRLSIIIPAYNDLHRLRMRIEEVPIPFDVRTRGDGKQITFWDGIVSTWTLLRPRLQSRSSRSKP